MRKSKGLIVLSVTLLALLGVSAVARATDYTARFMDAYDRDYLPSALYEAAEPVYWTGEKLPRNLDEMIAKVPAATGSYPMRHLATRLLLEVPVAGDEELLMSVLEQLMKIGAHSEAASLYQREIDLPENEALAKTGMNARILANKTDAACIDLLLLKQSFTGEYWDQAYVLCMALTGKHVPTAEKNITDSLFISLAESLSKNATPDLDAFKAGPVTPLSLSIFLAHGDTISKGLKPQDLVTLPTEYLVTIAGSNRISDALTARFTHTAVKKGLLSPEALAEVENSPAALKTALSKSKKASDNKKNAKSLKQAVEKSGGFSSPLTYAYAGMLSEIKPDSSHISLAIPATIMLYGIGIHNQADKWLALMTETPETDLTHGQNDQEDYLWPVLLVSNDTSLLGYKQRIEDMLKDKDILEQDGAARMLAALTGLGVVEPKKNTFKISSADKGVLKRLNRSAKKHHRGETALLGLIALGTDGPKKADPALVADVLESYRVAGLQQDARALGLEALIAGIENQPNYKEKYYGSSRSSTH